MTREQSVYTMRLNRFLARAGVASRRKSDELIARGLVRVNGEVVDSLGAGVDPQRDSVAPSVSVSGSDRTWRL